MCPEQTLFSHSFPISLSLPMSKEVRIALLAIFSIAILLLGYKFIIGKSVLAKKQYFKVKYPRYETLEGRIIIKIEAYFEPPKSTSKKQTEQMLENKISPTKKPDIDNIIKIVLDALNKMAFRDDSQVTKIEVEKIYGPVEKIKVKIDTY